MTAECPHCGQRMLMRHGVRLSPKKADIFDLIEHSGQRGVPLDVLADVFCSDRPRRTGRNTIKTTIWQINEILVEAGLKIAGERYGGYRVIKEVA